MYSNEKVASHCSVYPYAVGARSFMFHLHNGGDIKMKKLVGYIVAIAGLIVMALGFGTFKLDVGILNDVSAVYITWGGVALIFIGVVLTMMSDRKRSGREAEVPIYKGNEIVGYRRR